MNQFLDPWRQVWRGVFLVWGTLVVVYALAVLWFVATTPDSGIRCLLADQEFSASDSSLPGMLVRRVTGHPITGPEANSQPAPGDRVVQIGERSINSFLDFSAALLDLRRYELPPGGRLTEGERTSFESQLVAGAAKLPPIVERAGGEQRFVKAVFQRGQRQFTVWLPLESFPLVELLQTFVWFVLQLGILAVGGLAFWARPFDRASLIFFAMCLVTMAGFVGGFHWWIIAASLWLTIPFAISAMLVPVVTLHFFCLYPEEKPWIALRPKRAAALIYITPAIATAALVGLIIWINIRYSLGAPFPPIRHGLSLLVDFVHWCLGLAALYFVLTLAALTDSFFTSRNNIQQQQVKWILWAAVAATVPVGYTLYLARFENEAFALGAASRPMFTASLLFMLAYAFSILRHKLRLIDEVISRGVAYLALNLLVTVGATLAIAASCVLGLYQQARFPQQTTMVVAIVVASVLLVTLARDRLQQLIDRRFFREKFQLDRTVQPLIQSSASLGNPEMMAQRLLGSCRELLGVDRAALYLRSDDAGAFPLMASENLHRAPLRFASDEELLEVLEAEATASPTEQATTAEPTATQKMLRELDLELVHALEFDGRLAGALMLGPKRNGTRFSAEDLALLTSLGQVMRVALQGARVQQAVSRLNEELEHKTSRLAEQQRLITMLQAEVTSRSQTTAGAAVAAEEVPFRRDLIKGSSPTIRSVLETVRKVSSSQSSVLVRGESGTGKELLALALHDNSPRRNGPLVSVHCGALAAGLLESELFGHVKGAFTGAHRDKIGRFEMAQGGTLFLDEIGDISLETQVKLLRVLQQREFEPVGGTQTIPVDVRLIAATHQNLERLITEGRFREDLYYRLNVISITLPPLRDRGDDIVELALHFLVRAAERAGKRITHLDAETIFALRRYPWPGNIRELENAIERAVVLAEGESLQVGDLPAAIQTGTPASVRFEGSLPPLRTAESTPAGPPRPRRRGRPAKADSAMAVVASGGELDRDQLIAALARASGNKAEAARLLGVPRSTFFSRLKKFGLD